MKFSNLRLFLLVLAFSLGMGNFALAANKMDLEDSSGKNINDKDIFDEKNVYPGWNESETVNVQNESKESDVDLYITFDLDNGKKLAKMIKVYVIRKSDGSYRVGGAGDKYTLKEADDEDLFIGRLKAGEDEDYKIKVKFDKDAGNEYQNLSTQFDIDFEIEGRTVESLSEEVIFSYQGRTVTGDAPEDEKEVEIEEEEDRDPPKSVVKIKDEGVVAGEQTCQNKWPIWAWILLLIVFIGLISLIGSNVKSKDENASSIFWQVVLVVVMLLIWYFVDVCKAYVWFPILTVISGAVIATIFYKGEEVA